MMATDDSGPKKYWQTESFKRLQRAAYRDLAEDGFFDHEGGREDGPLFQPLRPGMLIKSPTTDLMEANAQASIDVLSSMSDINSVAVEALFDMMLWRGLPHEARRFWAMMTWCGWSPHMAGRFVGVTRHRYELWLTTIRTRLAVRRTVT